MRSIDTFATAVRGQGSLLVSGEVQFWRMEPSAWRSALIAVKSLGIDHVASYLSWRRHEPQRGNVDLRGGHGAELNVHRFLELCAELDMSVQLKPGPWICAEEPGGGLPDWILQDKSLMALDHAGHPVSGYNPPFKHPMPSYSSDSFRAAVEDWYEAVWSELAPFTGESGPIVATQLDNEPSLGFQDTMYGFDYHPDALRDFQDFVTERRGLPAGTTVEPPRPANRPADGEPLTAKHHDWIDFQEAYIANYLAWLQSVNTRLGVGHLVDFVNLNTHPVRGMPQSGTAIASELQPQGADGLAIVGEDHYFEPPLDERDIAGLALATAQGMASGTSLVWAPEMQAGIWRSPGENVTYPDPTVGELSAWNALGLAFGYQGFNLYMLVDRENWEFAPISPNGELRPAAEPLRRMLEAIASVPDLASYRPIPEARLLWDEETRRAAYEASGPQSAPIGEHDRPIAREANARLEATAATLTGAGLHFALVPEADAGTLAPLLVAGSEHTAPLPRPLVEAGTERVVARLHAKPTGESVLYVVPWTEQVPDSVQLTFAEAFSGRLVDARTGSVTPVVDGVCTLIGLEIGLTLLRVEKD